MLEYYPPHIGGVEVLFQNLCEGLASAGHQITVLTSKLKDTSSAEVVNGVRVVRVTVPQKGARYWFTALALPKAISLAGKADIVQTTTYNGAFPAWLAARLRGKKCVITVHEVLGKMWAELGGMGWLAARQHRFLEKLIVSLPFDEYVGVSASTCRALKAAGVRESKLKVVHNGIDSVLFNPAKADGGKARQTLGLKDEFIYMYYGRPGVSKGVEYLVKAAPLVLEQIEGSKLLLILAKDPSSGYQRVKKLIDELGVKDAVRLVDPVPRKELPNYIKAADCVVVPSLSEGFGFTAVEACAMGRPLVASNTTSLPEVVWGEYVLVEPKNPAAIAEGIAKIRRGEATRAPKKDFSWGKCAAEYESLHKSLLDKKKKAGRK